MNEPALISPAERRVLAYLKLIGRCEVKAIARSLQVTAMAVRHHLAVLEKTGLVKTTLERRGVGRPHYVYSLSASADALFPKEYGMLASNLIRSIAELDGETKLARIFEHMKEATVARYSSRMAGKPLRRRVAEMAKIMTGAGYMAEWEQLDHRTFQPKSTPHCLQRKRGSGHGGTNELETTRGENRLGSEAVAPAGRGVLFG